MAGSKEHPLSDSWKNKPLGFYEWCFCGCNLIGDEIQRYGLDPNVVHTPAMINVARNKYLQAMTLPLIKPSEINWTINNDGVGVWNMEIK